MKLKNILALLLAIGLLTISAGMGYAADEPAADKGTGSKFELVKPDQEMPIPPSTGCCAPTCQPQQCCAPTNCCQQQVRCRGHRSRCGGRRCCR